MESDDESEPQDRRNRNRLQVPIMQITGTGSSYDRINDESEESYIIDRRPSVMLPQLQNIEKKFFELVASGDVNAAKEFLQEHHGFNINCVNFQGVSALHVAVQIKSEAMVEFLLSQKSIDVGDTVLHAVRDNLPQILEMLLNHLLKTESGLEFTGYTQSSDFPDHITPLILAAQCGHYEIIEMLMERGHRISKPHRPDCVCEKCSLQLQHDDLLHAETRRLSLYRAVANPAYICHSTDDPILQSFVLSHELKQCAQLLPEFRAAYLELSEEVSDFAVDLIGYCRSTEEMELVLKQTKGSDAVHLPFPRLVLAIDYKQKRFVSHPNTQQILAATWHEDWHAWRSYSFLRRNLLVLLRIVMLPLITVLTIVMPFTKFTKNWSIPVNKLISHTAAYLLFLVLTFLQSNMSKTDQKRGPPNSGLEPILIVFVFGYIWSVIRLSILQGPVRYFKMLWSWYDLIMLFLFINTFFFWVAAYYEISTTDQPDLERKYWHYLDPTLVAEGMFSIATIMAFFRLLFIMQLDFYLGPLQISLGKMSVDIAKYMTIFVVIILAFSAGLCRLYHYYDGMVQVDASSGIKTVQESSFVDFEHTLKTLFWALFCMSPLESADVIIENLPGESDNSTIINQHVFTQAVGYIAFACFEVLTVIIILNMLIATMSNTFQKVTDNVEVEWTYGRTQVYVQYILQTTLPPPFNLIPTASAIMSILEWITVAGKSHPHKRALCSITHCCYIERDVDLQVVKDFPVLMSQLAQRYFRDKESSAQQNGELEAIRQEVNELKTMIRDMTKRY